MPYKHPEDKLANRRKHYAKNYERRKNELGHLREAVKEASEIIHDEFCGKECNPIHSEWINKYSLGEK